MKLGKLNIQEAGDRLNVSCEVTFNRTDLDAPGEIWYELPQRYVEDPTRRHDAFAVASILVASVLEEPLEVKGALSSRLIRGMEEYLRAFNAWFPGSFPPVQIEPEEIVARPVLAEGITASAFSGGVDSFFTLMNHRRGVERLDKYAIGRGVFVHGFDIALDDDETFPTAFGSYSRMFSDLGMELEAIRTNVRALTRGIGIKWEYAHGSALISVAHALGGLVDCFYVPSSNPYVNPGQWGSDPIIDHLLASESLEVIHDGSAALRAEKILALADWEATWPRLRVCWEQPDGLNNCCRCYNCLLVMSVLESAGKLDRYSTFALPFDLERMREVEIPWGWAVEGKGISDACRSFGRDDIADAVERAVFRTYPDHELNKEANEPAGWLNLLRRRRRR